VNRWVETSTRDDVVATIERCATRSTLSAADLIARIGLTRHRFYDWKRRRGRDNAHNAPIPKDGWLAPWEKDAIVVFFGDHPGEGYRRLTYMMMDDDVVAASPSSVYRVLKDRGLLTRWSPGPSKKGRGFEQPLRPHEHWHSDVSYLNIAGTFYYFFGLVDGASRAVVHWEIRESMKEADLEIVIERAKAKYPSARPRIISDNGPQYISREFREFIRLSGMTHVRPRPTTPRATARSNDSTARSNANASVPGRRSAWPTRAASSLATSNTTTRYAFTAPSATLRPWRCSKNGPRPSIRSENANSASRATGDGARTT
jgi:putative transposase